MSSRSGHRVLYVVGFHSSTRAKDLAAGFGKFGKLVRCDIPMSKYINSQPYAFVEYCESEDADNAFKDMHNVHLDGALIKVEWARRAPSSIWRTEGPPGERGNDTRDYTNTASWDRHDHRKSDRDYRSEGDDDRRHRRDYETGRNEERRHEPRIFDREEDRSERVYHHGHERDYERDRDRDEHRTQERDSGRNNRDSERTYNRHSERDHDQERTYDRDNDVEKYSKKTSDYDRVIDRGHDEDRENRRHHEFRERSRSPRRRDSGYIDSTAANRVHERHSSGYSRERKYEGHDRHSSGHSRESKNQDRDRHRSQDEQPSRYERGSRDEKKDESPHTLVRMDDWGFDDAVPAEVDGARTPPTPPQSVSLRPAGPPRDVF